MTSGRLRLVALAAVLAPGRALAILSRLGDPDADEVLAGAATLVAAPRRDRLATLAAMLAGTGEPSRDAPGLHPLLARLRLERWRSVPRTGDSETDPARSGSSAERA